MAGDRQSHSGPSEDAVGLPFAPSGIWVAFLVSQFSCGASVALASSLGGSPLDPAKVWKMNSRTMFTRMRIGERGIPYFFRIWVQTAGETESNH